MKCVNQPDASLCFQTYRQVSEQKIIWKLTSLVNFALTLLVPVLGLEKLFSFKCVVASCRKELL